MNPRTPMTAAVYLLVCATLCQANAQAREDHPYQVTGTYFVASLQPALQPLVINQIHRWRLQLTRLDGSPVVADRLQVNGGMPAHDHGLPTGPVAQFTGEPGRYTLYGMKFHMQGDWQIYLHIEADDRSEVLTLNLRL